MSSLGKNGSATLFDWLVAGHIAKYHATGIHITSPRVLSPPVFTQKMDGKTSPAATVAAAVAGVSTFPHLLACSL